MVKIFNKIFKRKSLINDKHKPKSKGYLPWFSIEEGDYVRGQGMFTQLIIDGRKSIWDKLKDNYSNYDEYKYWRYTSNYDLVPCTKEEAYCINIRCIK